MRILVSYERLSGTVVRIPFLTWETAQSFADRMEQQEGIQWVDVEEIES